MSESLIKVKTIGSLEKVFPETEPMVVETTRAGFQNEKFNFQLTFYNGSCDSTKRNTLEIIGELSEYVQVRTVEMVPATYFLPMKDDYYLKHDLSIYPDILRPLGSLGIVLPRFQWKSVWISVFNEKGLPTGTYPLQFVLRNELGEIVAKTSYTVEVLSGFLPACDIALTNWIHYDCIAQKHHAKPFSAKFYTFFEKYLKAYTDIGFNTLFTPIFTPPLDTAIGSERLTTQLVEIEKSGGRYAFNFTKLKKFVRFALKRNIRYIEFSHLFTQWGGEYCPKIIAKENGEEKAIFGWNTSATGEEYACFLAQFLPALMNTIDELGIKDRCYFHLTDEPQGKHLENYEKCRRLVKSYIGDIPIMDAMSDYSFYEKGLVDIPVAMTNTYRSFASHNVENLFVYYCCSPADGYYSNRFFNMPSQRTRVLGFQLYQSGVQGFLHWGYNFYNSAFSLCKIDPYSQTDAGGMFPSGDSFIVYPTHTGMDLSLRAEIIKEGFQDYSALLLLERRLGKEKAKEVLAEFGIDAFDVYPRSIQMHLEIRNQINRLIIQS